MTSSPTLPCALPELVVVTGASSGLGEATCKLLLDSGVRVIGVDLAPAPPLDEGAYTHLRGDITTDAVWAELRTELADREPRSLGLVTAAAVLEVGDVLRTGDAILRQTLEVNVVGTALAMSAVLPTMLELGAGAIVAVASVDAQHAEQQLAAYCASKGAVRQLARTVALDHARQGVRVNVLAPGPMRAGLFERHLASAEDPALFLETRSRRQPIGRILSAEEVARAALFLLSDAASGLIGADLTVDGGLTAGFDFRTGDEGASVPG